MAENGKIEQWLASRRAGEMERLRKLEEEAAEAWLESLSAEQREVFTELLDSGALSNWRFKKRTRQLMQASESVGFR